jgi:hypothetical protein
MTSSLRYDMVSILRFTEIRVVHYHTVQARFYSLLSSEISIFEAKTPRWRLSQDLVPVFLEEHASRDAALRMSQLAASKIFPGEYLSV